MGRNSLITNFRWQFFWKKWYFGKDKYWDHEYKLWTKFIFIGPLQICYYSDGEN